MCFGRLRAVLRNALITILLTTFCAAQQSSGSTPEANPGRPTVSTPATLTPVGYLQFETGGLAAQSSPEFSTRKNINEVIKLALHSRVQALLQIEPIARTRSGRTDTRFGDAFLGFQSVFIPGNESRPTLSFSAFHRVRDSGLPEVDFGSPKNSAILLVSGDVLGFHFDANGLANEVLNEPGSVRRAQFGQTLSISHPLWKLTMSGELWHFSQPFLNGNAVGNLWAISHPLRPNLVLDAGFDHGLTSTSTRWELFLGFTYLLPHRLWMRDRRVPETVRPLP
jgi:hypothetical protein